MLSKLDSFLDPGLRRSLQSHNASVSFAEQPKSVLVMMVDDAPESLEHAIHQAMKVLTQQTIHLPCVYHNP